MKVSETWMEMQKKEDKEAPGEKKIVYGDLLPFSDEICERYIQREEQLLGGTENGVKLGGTKDDAELGARMRWYRKSGRLALTYGWLIEKLTMPDTTHFSVEEECWRVVNAVYQERIYWIRDTMQPVARRCYAKQQFCDSRLSSFPVFKEIFVSSPGFGNLLLGRFPQINEFEWEALIGWLDYWHDNPQKEKKDFLEVVRALCSKLVERFLDCNLDERVFLLEAYAFEDPEARRMFSHYLLMEYCLVATQGARRGKLFPQMAKILRRADRAGENLYEFLLEYLEYAEVALQTGFPWKGILDDIYEMGKKNRCLDLADLDKIVRRQGHNGPHAVVSFAFGPAGEESFFAGGVFLWLGFHLQFSNREMRDFFQIQMDFMDHVSEAEMLLLRKNGLFPVETLRKLVRKLRVSKKNEKIPLLIQWMYEE